MNLTTFADFCVRIVNLFAQRGSMTENQVRRFLNPEREPNGLALFRTAFRNLVKTRHLLAVGKTQRAIVYGLK